MNTKTAPKTEPPQRTAAKTQVIHFEFTVSDAEAVAIAGTFNDWRPDASPMFPVVDGRWVKNLALAPGTYEYCFVVDGIWRPDPQVSETVTNPFGGVNTVLIVAAPAAPESPRPNGLPLEGRHDGDASKPNPACLASAHR